MKKAVLFVAPSGAGKSTLIKTIGDDFPTLVFSISATTRAPRKQEEHAKDYYFLSVEEFQTAIAEHRFLEWEEVYQGIYYGTLNREIQRIWEQGQDVIFDVDVKGALRIKEKLKENCLAIFIQPPTLDILEERLRNRGTETAIDIEKRIERASFEMTFSPQFDITIINDKLVQAKQEVLTCVGDFLNMKT